MSDDLKAAVARLREVNPYDPTGIYGEKWRSSPQVQQDCAKVVAAYLDEHPIDEELSITAERLLAIGLFNRSADAYGAGALFIFKAMSDRWRMGYGGVPFSQYLPANNIGDVRRLAAVLGVKLIPPALEPQT